MRKVLFIPDCHTHPGEDLSRFDCLGRLIVEQKPDLIVEIGDFMTVDSLSSWNKNKRLTMEDARFALEQDIAVKALSRLFAPLHVLQEKQRKHHSGIYRPTTVHCMGNHEDRIYRYAETHPEMSLTLFRDLAAIFSPFDHVIEYKEYYESEGILFTHAPCNAGGKPVSGKYAMARAVNLVQKSTVFGHLHRREMQNLARHGMEKQDVIQVMSGGAFFEGVDEYVRGATNHYCRCVQILHQWGYGRFDAEEWSIERLRYYYG